jgi:pimeloyl-ACP methyl ester carboxylesterase
MKRLKTWSIAFAAAALTTLVIAGAASAAPVIGPAGEAFYTAPASLPAANGTLIQYRANTLALGSGAPGIKSWQVMYKSSKVDGSADAVTGTVVVPTATWTGGGTRPIVTYALGTQGIGKQCAGSKQLQTGTEYEIANIVAALQRGYAVVITDYDGYTLNGKPTYSVAGNEGRDVLDIVRAADDIPNIGISATGSKTAIWGYSIGGQAAASAGELEASYASELNVVAVAAGGVPADLRATAQNLDGANGSSFLLSAIYGLSNQYPSAINLATLANPAGQAVIADGATLCTFEALFKYVNKNVSDYTVGNKTMNTLLADPTIGSVVDAQKLGNTKPAAPVLLYHGEADEFIPLAQALKLKSDWCGKGARVSYASFKSEHITTQFQAAGLALDFIRDRIANKFDLGTCLTLNQKPTATNNDPKGDLIFSLKNWTLSGKVGLKLLGQDVVLPSGSKFSADANLKTNTLYGDGAVKIPEFNANISILGIPVTIGLTIQSVGATTGSTTVDNNGKLHIHATTKINIVVRQIGTSPLAIPIGCHTASPSTLPVDYDGPISDLGGGKVGFSGTTTFADMTGCGLLDGPLSLLMSGPGQTFAFTVAPPGSTWY